MDPLLDENSLTSKLGEWGTSDSFANALDAWMDEHCKTFERGQNEDGSEPLEWGSVFASYGEWLDEKLEDFCKGVGVDASEVSSSLAAALEVPVWFSGDNHNPQFVCCIYRRGKAASSFLSSCGAPNTLSLSNR